MLIQRLIYVGTLIGSIIFYTAYQEWFSYIVLLIVLVTPLISLLTSLPAMLQFRMRVEGPQIVPIGTKAEVQVMGGCKHPMPPFKAKLRLHRCTTGEEWRRKGRADLPIDHCGAITVTLEHTRVYDYLGLIGIPARVRDGAQVLIRPKRMTMEPPKGLKRFLAGAWRPKHGGGFSEHHELRPYQAGDSLNQIHWKLTAKTGEMMLREPMQPDHDVMLLTMDIDGTPEELDRKFGKLLFLGSYMLENDLPFELRAMTETGLCRFWISTEDDLSRAADRLLCCGPTKTASVTDRHTIASWQYHIGGDADET